LIGFVRLRPRHDQIAAKAFAYAVDRKEQQEFLARHEKLRELIRKKIKNRMEPFRDRSRVAGRF